MPKIFVSSFDSFTCLNVCDNADWWKKGSAFPQLLVFCGRQSRLKVLGMKGNDLTDVQTTQLLQCVAKSNKELEKLWLRDSTNFD